MASFDVVNYNLRPSKSIQRQIIFDGIRRLQSNLDLAGMIFIGLGSVWFTDFIMAHKQLNIDEMISIEGDPIGYSRALFNVPYATVRVFSGLSSIVLPKLCEDASYNHRPWLVWLDFDYDFGEAIKEDIRTVIEKAPQNSIFLITFNGKGKRYGQTADRPAHLRGLYGSIVSDELSKENCADEILPELLASLTIDYMKSIASELSRPGNFIPAFQIIYKDSAPMVTVGGVLPSKGAATAATSVVRNTDWPCKPDTRIVAPHLTTREAAILQSQLPRETALTREFVNSLGFDLGDEQIKVFEKYYRQYPSFAQIVS